MSPPAGHRSSGPLAVSWELDRGSAFAHERVIRQSVRVRDEFVTLGALRFRFREWGDRDGETVVFLHGILMYADAYDAITERLSSTGRRVIVFDQRGHGQSEHADDYSWQSCEQDL